MKNSLFRLGALLCCTQFVACGDDSDDNASDIADAGADAEDALDDDSAASDTDDEADQSDGGGDADALADGADETDDGAEISDVIEITEGQCQIPEAGPAPASLRDVQCRADFFALASEPVSASLPGARSVKVVLDTSAGDELYFQNSVDYQIHYEFASANLSGGDFPLVPDLASFNATEYYSPERRFILGSVTFYDGPQVWALEIAPYDTASAAMITRLYEQVAAHAYFGPALSFHPTSENVQVEADLLGDDIPQVSTDELYDGTDYQPLSLATAIGRLRFELAADLETTYLSYEDIVVLDEAPNDISVVRGLITEEFQTPLSHVNVLSQNRGTPNMGLRGATTNEQLLALEGKFVELTVGATEWTVREVTAEEAAQFTVDHRPEPVVLPALDLSVTDLRDIEFVTAEPGPELTMREAIAEAARSYGGKSAHYSILARTSGLPVRKAFGIPVYYYDQFLRENGFWDTIDTWLADPEFVNDPGVRETRLEQLRLDMMSAPVNEEFQQLLRDKWDADYAGRNLRFRTSTNSEDLDGFPCAGCYESHTGKVDDWVDVLDAIRETYASAWLFRTFEERSYYGVAHNSVGMALLVHPNFGDEEANGVAVTSNPFDASGLDPAFYVNVQFGGDAEVVHPPAGVSSDQFLLYFYEPNQPTSYISHSSLIPDGETVLTRSQTRELGLAMDLIHQTFSPAYGPASGNSGWYAMDIEFKFDDEDSTDGEAHLIVKQARPYPGR